MSKYNVPFVVLAGKNKGKYKEQEMSDKNRSGKLYQTKFLDGDDKLFVELKNGKSVLENTLDSIYPVSSKRPLVISGDEERLKQSLPYSSLDIEPQKGSSLTDNVYQAIDSMHRVGENSGFVLIGGDLPSISTKDLEEFIEQSYAENKDVVMGLADVDEMNALYPEISSDSTTKPKKFGIRLRDDKGAYASGNPKLNFGTVFFIRDTLYDKKDDLRDRLDEIISLKRLFNDTQNYPVLAEFLKDEHKEMAWQPNSKLSLAYFALTNSTPLRKLLFGNFFGRAKTKYAMTITEVEELIETKIFNSDLSLGITRVSPMFGYDIDDENDVAIANSIIMNKGC
ncbi:MAG: NTP transferase domain-containing protein [Nanoarchaeota archaeon]